MAKVFTTEFKYKSVKYPAVITVRTQGEDHSVYAQIFDKDLHHIVPDGELHFRLTSGLQRAAVPVSSEQRDLIQSIKEVVMQYLNKSISANNL